MNNQHPLASELSLLPDGLLWPDMKPIIESAPEQIFLLEAPGGKPLTLVSNYPYELWLDGMFIGDGGHRCTPGEALADYWEVCADAKIVLVRLHWLDPKQTSVLYRCLFEDAFFASLPPSVTWKCSLDNSVRFAARASAQLPRQNIILQESEAQLCLTLQRASLINPWKILRSPIEKARFVGVEPKLISSQFLKSQEKGQFRPQEAQNIALYVRDYRPCDLKCDTYDLGQIALHRFEVKTGSSPCVLYYSEVASFEEVASTRYRAKVQLADAISERLDKASPFGTRGCRYVHVLYAHTDQTSPVIQVWRREYPLKWKAVKVTCTDAVIVAACRANLIACVDGGVVDTCWRERAQWTGDLRMSALALRSLANNPEVVNLALHQIAQSYNSRTGLVNGAWPVLHPQADFPIPLFHLSFCLTALEQYPDLQGDPLVRRVVHDSFMTWRKHYLSDGLVHGMPGWYFTDWDSTDLAAAGRDKPYPGPHAVCNAWWNELCEYLAPEQAVSSKAYDNAFWMGQAYALTTDKLRDSPHATAVALNSSVGCNYIQQSLCYLEREISCGRLAQRVTPYFGYFVAQALRHISQERVIAFVQDFYKPIAQVYGTIYEKTSGNASLAHGWSVGFASLLIRGFD